MYPVIPKNSYSRDELKNWSLYEQNLSNYPTIKKYLGAIMQKWVENLNNPLAVKWLKYLWRKDDWGVEYMIRLNENLTKLESLNREILEKLHDELPKNEHKEYQIINKILSFEGEMKAFKYLEEKGFSTISPVKSDGDFLCDGKVLVSVKSKLDANIDIIYDYIQGLRYLDGNDLINNYRFSIEKLEKAGYDFFDMIFDFFLNDIEKLVDDFCSEQDIDIYEGKRYIPNNNVAVKIRRAQRGKHEVIEIEIKEFTSQMDINIGKRNGNLLIELSNSNTIPIDRNFKVYYPEEAKFNFKAIEPSIYRFLSEFENAASKIRDKDFFGFIYIPLKNEKGAEFVNSQYDIQQQIKKMTQNCKFRVIVCFDPEFKFDMKNTVYIEEGRG